MRNNYFEKFKKHLQLLKSYQNQTIKHIKELKKDNKINNKLKFAKILKKFNDNDIESMGIRKQRLFLSSDYFFAFKLDDIQYILATYNIEYNIDIILNAGLYYSPTSVEVFDKYASVIDYLDNLSPIYIKKGFFNQDVKLFKELCKIVKKYNRLQLYNNYYEEQLDKLSINK